MRIGGRATAADVTVNAAISRSTVGVVTENVAAMLELVNAESSRYVTPNVTPSNDPALTTDTSVISTPDAHVTVLVTVVDVLSCAAMPMIRLGGVSAVIDGPAPPDPATAVAVAAFTNADPAGNSKKSKNCTCALLFVVVRVSPPAAVLVNMYNPVRFTAEQLVGNVHPVGVVLVAAADVMQTRKLPAVGVNATPDTTVPDDAGLMVCVVTAVSRIVT